MLRNLFGNLTAGIIRLLVAVGILAAAYFFIVKPVLKSADDAVKSTSTSFERSLGGAQMHELDRALKGVGREVEAEVDRSLHAAGKTGNPRKLLHCVEHAKGNEHRMHRCAVKF